MNTTIYISLTLCGLLALVLSELMSLSASATRTGLTWLGYGLWGVAAVMLAYAFVRAGQERRGRKRGETGHEM